MSTASAQQTSPMRIWHVDPARSTLEFRTKSLWGLATTAGRFDRFDGRYAIGQGGCSVELTIDASSLDTDNRRRDTHLRSTDFFDVERHPYVRFDANHVSDLGDGKLAVVGELEAAGKRVSLAFEALVEEVGGELEVEATTTVDHRLLGMTWSPLGMVRAPTTLHARVRLRPGGDVSSRK
jgi:polyisoprenoid-binding protein YceI